MNKIENRCSRQWARLALCQHWFRRDEWVYIYFLIHLPNHPWTVSSQRKGAFSNYLPRYACFFIHAVTSSSASLSPSPSPFPHPPLWIQVKHLAIFLTTIYYYKGELFPSLNVARFFILTFRF